MANPKPIVPKPKKPYKAKTSIGKDLKKTDDFLEKKYPSLTKSSTYKSIKSGVKDIASALGFKKGGAVPKGYHKMPDGKIMKNSAHKKTKKKG
jgi:hypothetical protein